LAAVEKASRALAAKVADAERARSVDDAVVNQSRERVGRAEAAAEAGAFA